MAQTKKLFEISWKPLPEAPAITEPMLAWLDTFRCDSSNSVTLELTTLEFHVENYPVDPEVQPLIDYLRIKLADNQTHDFDTFEE